MDKIATKANIDPNQYEIILTITGAGGYGKTTIVTSLCYHIVVKKHFVDGFIFIELGPQAPDPSVKLNQLYHLLTGEYCNINHYDKITCK